MVSQNLVAFILLFSVRPIEYKLYVLLLKLKMKKVLQWATLISLKRTSDD